MLKGLNTRKKFDKCLMPYISVHAIIRYDTVSVPHIVHAHVHPEQFLLHDGCRTQRLKRLDNLLCLLLGHTFLHHLGRALDELLAVHQ